MNNKTRFSALMLAVVMMVSLLSAFPMLSASAEMFSKDFEADINYGDDDYATLNMSGPTQVNLGDEFEITVTWKDIMYQEMNGDVVGSVDVYLSRRPSGLRKNPHYNSLAHRTTWLRSDFSDLLQT